MQSFNAKILVIVCFSRFFCEILALPSPKPSNILIIQNKGGGHGSIGYQLCKSILNKGPANIHLVQDKCNYKSVPFSSYQEIKDSGVIIHDCNLADAESVATLTNELAAKNFDAIVDNWSKNADNAKLGINIAKQTHVNQYIFISSAGMYKSGYEAPIEEDDPVKTNDARKVEIEVTNSGIPFTFLRPQYIYGTKCNKRYLDFFIGRAYRKLPIPLPLHSEQLVCLTHIEDIGDFIAASILSSNAINQVFNCGTDRFISYKGLSKAIHTELGNSEEDQKFLSYDPENFPDWDGKGVQEFPFRKETFITSNSKAKQLLNWKPKHIITNDLKAEIEEYKSLGGFDEKWSNEEIKYDLEVIDSKKV